MAVSLRKNQYRGVNAHLHSMLQTPGTASDPSSWKSFHAQHIVNITEYLNAQLPEGYLAVNEQSLQILSETDGGLPLQTRPIPDSSIFRQRTQRAGARSQAGAVAEPTWEAAVEQTLETDNSV